MKKNTTYSFWFIVIFLTGGVFALWSNFFQAGSVTSDAPKHIALNVPQRSVPQVFVVPQDTLAPQKTQGVTVQNNQSTTSKPAPTRKTKTS